jgi:galactoside O-acetyltransferase
MFLNEKQLSELELKSIGKNVLISDKCSIYGKNITIGNNVRIDDFCILSGHIELGNNIHIGAYCGLYGSMGIKMDSFTGLSPRCTIFSASDDFGGDYLISPMTPEAFTNVTGGLVHFKMFVQLGSGAVVMPSVTLAEGVAIGAMSFVKHSILDVFTIYAGNPIRFIKNRDAGLINKHKNYLKCTTQS